MFIFFSAVLQYCYLSFGWISFQSLPVPFSHEFSSVLLSKHWILSMLSRPVSLMIGHSNLAALVFVCLHLLQNSGPCWIVWVTVTTKIVFSYRNLRLPCDVCVSSAVQFAVLGQSKKNNSSKNGWGSKQKKLALKELYAFSSAYLVAAF